MFSNKALSDFQVFLGYNFKNKGLLVQALVTPQRGHELAIPSYEGLDTLGDAIIKTILISKKIKEGVQNKEGLTKLKQGLENNITLVKIASRYFNLEKYIYRAKNQEIEGTKILADIFEALCSAIFLDSNSDILMIEKKIIDKFYADWDELMDKNVLKKNDLLEYLQDIFKITPKVAVEYEGTGPPNEKIWIGKNPKILDDLGNKLIDLPQELKSKPSKTQPEADKDLYMKILQYLKNKEQRTTF